MTENHIFGQIHRLMFVILMIFFHLIQGMQLPSVKGKVYRVSIHLYFGQVQRLTFIIIKFRSSSNVKVRPCQFFWSNSNQFSVILIWSSKLVSMSGPLEDETI